MRKTRPPSLTTLLALTVPLFLTMTPAMVFEHATIRDLAAAVGGTAAPETGDRSHAPMSASGLDADTLAQLTSAWNSRQ